VLVQTPVFQPGETHVIGLQCFVPPDPGLLNTVVHLEAILVPVPMEDDLSDNVMELDRPVVAAYDPNDKLVTPYGDPLTHGVDTTVHQLRYTIRFQNTGNWPATHVRLEDELPALLVPQSLHVVASSHAMQAYSFGGVLHFEFPSIMLPDSASDPDGSIGWVTFTLDVADGVLYGDSIVNIAGIYFDQNPPIITPPAITRFLSPITTGMPAHAAEPPAQRFVLAPNPATGWLSIVDRNGTATIQRVELIDARGAGQVVRREMGQVLSLDGLASGTYTVRIHTTEGVHAVRLVKY